MVPTDLCSRFFPETFFYYLSAPHPLGRVSLMADNSNKNDNEIKMTRGEQKIGDFCWNRIIAFHGRV